MRDERLLEILVCPVSKGPLEYDHEREELLCRPCGLAYPVIDGKPIMVEAEARQLSAEERERK